MPAPNNPPFEAGALTQPRQLQRWLDVNKVNKLTRTQTYWELPAFSVEGNWLGYSQLVAAFDFTATNNFSLPTFEATSSPGYCACIMWVDSDYNVYRYRLWADVGEVFYFLAPLYSGQLIKKNFRIEIWDVAPAVNPPLVFTLNSGGTADVNGEYTYVEEGEYSSPNASMSMDGSGWGVYNLFDTSLYSTPLYNFPFGLYSVVNGDAPPPYASVAIVCTSEAALTFYTSVAGQYDYMWADDNVLATAAAINTNFSVALPADLPIQWPAASVPVLNS